MYTRHERRFLSVVSKEGEVITAGVQLQELPDQKFWTVVFEELVADYPGDDIVGAKIEKWLKKPRDAVKKGEAVVELEIAGAVIALSAETSGFLGPQLVEEGTLLHKGEIAARILSAPEPLPIISEDEMGKVMMDAEGSVSEMKVKLVDIETQRAKILEDMATAYHLASIQGLSKSPSDSITSRVPGQPGNIFTAPMGFYGAEVTKDVLLQVEVDSGTVVESDAKTRRGHELQADRRAVCVHGTVLRSLPHAACVLSVVPMHVTALSYAGAKFPDILQLWDFSKRFPGAVSMDTGVPLDDPAAEGKRIAAALGADKRILVLPGRGVLIVAPSVAEAYDDLYHLERACALHVRGAMAGHVPAAAPPPASAANGSATPAARRTRAVIFFEGLKRLVRNDLAVPVL